MLSQSPAVAVRFDVVTPFIHSCRDTSMHSFTHSQGHADSVSISEASCVCAIMPGMYPTGFDPDV